MSLDRTRRIPIRLACLALGAVALAACGNGPPSQPAPSSTPESSVAAAPSTPDAAPAATREGAGDPYYPTDGNGGYDVTGYHVSISYDPRTKKLDGDTVVTATATADLTVFDLDLRGFDVSAVEIDDHPARFERSGEHELVITSAGPIAKDSTFRTRVRYSGVPQSSENGTLGTNGWQLAASGGAFAAGEPHAATSWYPANDTPRDKATFALSARVPNGWSVISNGHEEASTSDGGWTTFNWVEPNRIATYLTTVGIDHWIFERSTLPGGIPLVNAYAPGTEDKKADEAKLPEIIELLSQKFGPYPQSAAGGIYVDQNIGFSLETQTRPIYARWATLPTVVHENAHQWFGDSVTVSSWADICLNECFASYAQWLWDEAKEHKDLDAQYRAQIAQASDRFWSGRLYDMGAGNEFTNVYTKGPVALHALRRQIGDERFFKLLHEWQAAHKDGNASWPQFEELAQQVSGQSLRGFFDAWFHGTTRPGDEYLYPGDLHR